MILCDTNILIEFYKNNPMITQTLQRIGQEQLAISIVTQAELYYGALDTTELQKIKRHLQLVHRFPIDKITSAIFLQLMETFSLSHRLSLPDALIAATALRHNLELYTLNKKDFRYIPELSIYQV
ncbi:MAG: type II toxin-antitoxin system VapC family toxin [Anaerolineae bacterium]|nr:type II toxin-antitoxin system VapC family toxin [Anaerolineae bacterium]